MGRRLEGKTALITGGARGIGRAFAEGFVKEGAKVALADIIVDVATKAAGEIGAGTIAVELDVTNQKSIDGCVHKVLAQFGHIDILVNCAAVFDMAPVGEISRESYDRVFAANVSGTLFMTQAIARHMIERGKGGKVINMASQAGRQGDALVTVYCASKAAVISLTQSTGLALIKHGINVNGIAPGYVDTEMWRQVDKLCAKYEKIEVGEKTRQTANLLPIGRMGVAEDLVGAAVFLASEESDYVVGQTFNVDGGSRLN
ncbi:hypothetical protein niasHT_015599 [Heterodera trifolii]|uniref:Ketoreductase domain-containing protein n=1 Tax=Heterodera trifolii TaxID=157864 RepID=A0ABD2LCI9_9BILA